MDYWYFWIALALNVLVHELGHAAALLILRLPIARVVWGFGPQLFRLGRFEMRLVPISGSTHSGIRSWKGNEIRGVLFALSGVIAQWAILFALLTHGFHHKAPELAAWWFFFCMFGLRQWLPIGYSDGRLALSCLAALCTKSKGWMSP